MITIVIVIVIVLTYDLSPNVTHFWQLRSVIDPSERGPLKNA